MPESRDAGADEGDTFGTRTLGSLGLIGLIGRTPRCAELGLEEGRGFGFGLLGLRSG